jgi:hypothetical protein
MLFLYRPNDIHISQKQVSRRPAIADKEGLRGERAGLGGDRAGLRGDRAGLEETEQDWEVTERDWGKAKNGNDVED